MAYIYCITNLINNKRYVGKTTNSLQERFREHCRDSRKLRYNKRPLYDAMNKYGIENFMIELLEEVSDESILSEREIYWIQELKTYGCTGYNATKGGDGKIVYDYHEIIELANLGYTTQQICDKVHCCKDTIYNVCKSHNVQLRYAKRIAQYDLAGNFIQIFYGATEAQNWLLFCGLTNNINAKAHIIRCCIGKEKQCYGYKWMYIPEPK